MIVQKTPVRQRPVGLGLLTPSPRTGTTSLIVIPETPPYNMAQNVSECERTDQIELNMDSGKESFHSLGSDEETKIENTGYESMKETCDTRKSVIRSERRIFSSAAVLKKKINRTNSNFDIKDSRNSKVKRTESSSPNKERMKKTKQSVYSGWKKIKQNGELKSVYVSMNGEKFDGNEAFQKAKSEKAAIDARLSHEFKGKNTSDDPFSLDFWNIPIQIQRMYSAKGIRRLYEWQVECLNKPGILNGKNLVYSAPTNAGKTLVAEFLVIHQVIKQRKKALLILPFVSIVVEKARDFQEKLNSFGISVKAYHSHVRADLDENIDIAVCTPEKANGICLKLIEEKRIQTLGIVVVDEIHMIGDSSRGSILEILMTKFVWNRDIQIVAMSATITNIQDLSSWINGELYITNFRPIPLKQYLCIEQCLISCENFQEVRKIPTKDQLSILCLETIRKEKSVLVFAPTREWCQNSAILISRFFIQNLDKDIDISHNPNIASKRKDIIDELEKSDGYFPELSELIYNGVAFHHAGLSVREREIIEKAFRQGSISVIVATSTLAAGVNLPAHRVIIRSPQVGCVPLDRCRYHQMIGRAGRAGLTNSSDSFGESIIMGTQRDQQLIRQLISQPIEAVESTLNDSKKLSRLILEGISIGYVSTEVDIIKFTSKSFLAAHLKDSLRISQFTQDSLMYLSSKNLIQLNINMYSCTSFGIAVAFGGLDIDESLEIYENLCTMRKGMSLKSPLHLIFLCCSEALVSNFSEINFDSFEDIYHSLDFRCRAVAQNLDITDDIFQKFIRKRNAFVKEAPMMRCKKFFIALLLMDTIQEKSLDEVSRKFCVMTGSIQSLQSSSASFARMLSIFCEKLGWRSLALLTAHLSERFSHGVQSDILPLMQISGIRSSQARALYASGLKTIDELRLAPVEKIADALRLTSVYSPRIQEKRCFDDELKLEAQRIINLVKTTRI